MNYSQTVIEGERIILKLVSIDYAKDIFKEFNQDVTLYMLPKQASDIRETLEFITTSELKALDGTDFTYMILDKDTHEFLGCGGVHHLDRHTPELGIWIKKGAHGHHYGLEAVNISYQYFKDQYQGFIYPVDRRNIASKKIALSLGGTLDSKYTQKNTSGKILYLEKYVIKTN